MFRGELGRYTWWSWSVVRQVYHISLKKGQARLRRAGDVYAIFVLAFAHVLSKQTSSNKARAVEANQFEQSASRLIRDCVRAKSDNKGHCLLKPKK